MTENNNKQKTIQPPLVLDPNILRSRKFMVCTPMYGGNCTGYYMNSLMALKEICTGERIQFEHFATYTESLITRARNYCADHFLRSDCSHLMFIDSDINFNPLDVLALLQLADPLSDYDVVCGPYALKQINWHNIVAAVNSGAVDNKPVSDLEKYAGSAVFSPVESGEYAIREPMKVREAGTGFMMIQRHVFERLAKLHPENDYYPDHVATSDFGGERMINAFFMDPIDTTTQPGRPRHISEDYFFCKQTREAGMNVWMCPWMVMGHVGFAEYRADIQMMANINVPIINTKKLDQ